MRITIDTKEDSHEEIRKVLHILSGLVDKRNYSEHSSGYSTPTRQEEPTDTTNMMSMFSDSSSSNPANDSLNSTKTQQASDSPPDFSALLNLANIKRNEDEKKEETKIEFF